MGLAAVLLSKLVAHNTLAFGQKCGASNCWGYRLEQYAFSKQTTLTITAIGGKQITYELPKLLVERANEDRWMAGDRAIYLNFRLKPFDDPGAEGTRFRVLYDFQRGEMYTSSTLALPHSPDDSGGAPKNLTEAEFQRVLTGIEP